MKYCLPALVVRFLLAALLVTELSGCSLYHRVFHPYRLPTPKPSPEYKAQLKANKEKKRGLLSFSHGAKSKAKQAASTDDEAATDVSTPTGGSVKTPTAAPEARTLPERSTVHYDKNGLMKKPKLMRRRRHKPAGKPFRPWQSVKHLFKFKLHGKPNYDPSHKPVPRAPKSAAEPTAPGAPPAPKP